MEVMNNFALIWPDLLMKSHFKSKYEFNFFKMINIYLLHKLQIIPTGSYIYVQVHVEQISKISFFFFSFLKVKN